MNSMKKILLCFLVVISASGLAGAAPVVIFEAPISEFQSVSATFDFDSKLGRAWVEVESLDSEFEPSWNAVTRKRVDGLSYDSQAKQVLYQRGDRPIVCAEETSFLGISSLKSTGNCPLQVSYEARTVDDGFHPRKETFAKVTLNPQIGPTQTAARTVAKGKVAK
jgi:hypothetical protein